MDRKLEANAFPAKKFFVNMLTRDINLSDAILDLLDNCVDGIIRSKKVTKTSIDSGSPYLGYYAKIEMNDKFFKITDNCGGIPLKVAIEYAFMMGRDKSYDENLPTVGMYGIGMKRALFKMGMHSSVLSKTIDGCFEVEIDRNWLESETDWHIPIKLLENDTKGVLGTEILITDLYPSISSWFSNANFINNFREIISHNFSYIIKKGFKIFVNEIEVISAPLNLLFDKSKGIAPYLYSAKIGNVEVLLEVGLSGGIPSEDEIEQELISRHSKEESGWTIVCNDRVVVYKDKTIETGWGEAGVPTYHSQFNGINGVVFFNSNNPEELPLNTTKRGLDHSSKLYLEIKNHMRTGTKLFTDYTNHWKKFRDEEKALRKNVVAIDTREVSKEIESTKWNTITNNKDRVEKVFKPTLPKPVPKTSSVQIAFRREISEVQKVSEYLFNTSDKSASTVGNECFELILRSIEE
ncbi:ATP-binding protein [Brevibacillus brevis]|nr:ATP-binding protein [Brevibacillus brevis]